MKIRRGTLKAPLLEIQKDSGEFDFERKTLPQISADFVNEFEKKFLHRFDFFAHRARLYRVYGKIKRVVGIVVEADGPRAKVGEVCEIEKNTGRVKGEVVGFSDGRVLVMPYGSIEGLEPGMRIYGTGSSLTVPVAEGMLGSVLDGIGHRISGSSFSPEDEYPVFGSAPSPLKRVNIREPLETGVRVIDGLLTLGKGQRVGIFSGSGVGKTTLLSMIARGTEADVVVLALVGERGREVKEFLDRDLVHLRKKAVFVVATSDSPPLARLRAPFVATAVAEFFRDRGANVLLLMDSITRFAWAQREVGLASGEPPSTRGYPPSVFNLLPQLMERAGAFEKGTITAIYTVLMEADDLTDPLVDHTRGILDGHIVLSRDLAARSHFPAVDVLNSISRVMNHVTDKRHYEAASKIREAIAVYRDSEDLINIGAYVKGANPVLDWAVERIDRINSFLRQGMDEATPFEKTVEMLLDIVG